MPIKTVEKCNSVTRILPPWCSPPKLSNSELVRLKAEVLGDPTVLAKWDVKKLKDLAYKISYDFSLDHLDLFRVIYSSKTFDIDILFIFVSQFGTDLESETALSLAICNRNKDLFELLLKMGAQLSVWVGEKSPFCSHKSLLSIPTELPLDRIPDDDEDFYIKTVLDTEQCKPHLLFVDVELMLLAGRNADYFLLHPELGIEYFVMQYYNDPDALKKWTPLQCDFILGGLLVRRQGRGPTDREQELISAIYDSGAVAINLWAFWRENNVYVTPLATAVMNGPNIRFVRRLVKKHKADVDAKSFSQVSWNQEWMAIEYIRLFDNSKTQQELQEQMAIVELLLMHTKTQRDQIDRFAKSVLLQYNNENDTNLQSALRVSKALRTLAGRFPGLFAKWLPEWTRCGIIG